MTDQVKAIRPPARNLSRPRADTTTPLETLGKAPLADVPAPPTPDEQLRAIGITPTPRAYTEPPTAEPEKAKRARTFSFSTEIAFKGRVITVHADGMTLSEFSALLDDHGFAPVTE